MDASSSQELLLASTDHEAINSFNKFLSSFLKRLLKIAMLAAFIFWLLLVFMYPLESVETLIEDWTDFVGDSFLGSTGGAFLLFSGPVLIIAILSGGYLILSSGEEEILERKEIKGASYRLWTFPVVVKGPFGVVSAAELIGITAFAVYLVWVAGVYAWQKLSVVYANSEFTTQVKWSWYLRMSGRGFGLAGAFCLSFMLIPISRGSSLLRFLNIPFEHAIRYHVWLGHLCLCLFTCHGFFYFVGWILAGEIPSELISWTSEDGANLAGIINIFFGWSIWLTSLPLVRQKNFELFYYTHHLYIIFIIFFAMHVGNFFFCIIAGAIFLFMMDRFLRFCQSQTLVNVISTTCFPCGAVELVFSRPKSLSYNTLSSVSLRLQGISSLQWHQFSVSSSPLYPKNCISVIIKACGDWTSRVQEHVCRIADKTNRAKGQLHLQHTSQLIASVEGPYGLEFPYQLWYENLVLVAGGIGISPFIAILNDIVQRIKQDKTCLLRNILLIWTMKRSNELSLLSIIGMDTLLLDKLHFKMLIYVTQESETTLDNSVFHKDVRSSIHCASSINTISVLGYTSKIWFGGYMISSTIGLFILMILLNVIYITPYRITNWWYQALLLLACMVASVIFFGGVVLALWYSWGKRKSKSNSEEEKFDEEQNNEHILNNDSFLDNFASLVTIRYGSRPDFKEIFESISKLWGNVDVGVIVCGPLSMEASIATECKSHNINRNAHGPIFHFYNNSFSL